MRQMLANRRVVDTDKPDHGIPAGTVLLMAGDFGKTRDDVGIDTIEVCERNGHRIA